MSTWITEQRFLVIYCFDYSTVKNLSKCFMTKDRTTLKERGSERVKLLGSTVQQSTGYLSRGTVY